MAGQHSGHLQFEPCRLRNVLNHRIFLLAVLRYYQATHKPEYALNPCSQNQLIHLSSGLASPREPMLEKTKHARNWGCLRWSNAMQSGGLTLHQPLLELWDQGWLEYRWDLYLLDFATQACAAAHSNDTAVTFDERMRRASYVVEWVKEQLSPEHWQESLLPDLLCIRAHPGVIVGSESDPYFLKNRDTTDSNNDEPSDNEHTLSGYGLLESKSWLLDWEAHPPGHPLLAQQTPATENEQDGDGHEDGQIVPQ